MSRMRGLLLVVAVWLSFPAGTALADGMVLPLPETLGLGYPAVRSHHVHVEIVDGLAVTRVEQEFYNPYQFPLAGRYLFPVPPEAVLSGFRVSVDGLQQNVIRQDATETNATLYAAVNQQSDPSLLQYADWESLAFYLDLPAGSSRIMTLEYQEMLAPQGGLYRYRYVLSTERYSSRPLEQASVTVDLRGSTGLASVYSSSHEVDIVRLEDGGRRVFWDAEGTTPTQDFELFFAPAEDGVGAGLLTGQRRGQGHFLFLVSPEVGQGAAARLPKDIVFVMDRSGSMSGEKIEQVKNALQQILDQLHVEDRFAVLAFNDRVSALSYGLRPAEGQVLQEARRYVEGLSADGGTDLEVALRTALEILLGTPERGATRLVVFLSDGLPTSGRTDESEIADVLARTNEAVAARIHVFGAGYDVNTHLLDRLATDSRGTVTYIRPGESLELALTEFYGKVADPVLTDLHVDFQGLEVSDLYPQVLPDLFQGSSLLLTGQYQASADQVSVQVTGWAGKEYHQYVYSFRLDNLQNHDFVARLWATRHIGALLDQIRTEGWSQAREDKIRDLGLAYGVITPYTEFAIENQASGAASAGSMALYTESGLHQASGRVAIEARLQNQAYQQAAQAGLAQGANLTNYGRHSLAEIGNQQVDLSLLQGRQDLGAPITSTWLEHSLRPDRIIEFGSEEYFALASDPEARPYLQSGRDVIFSYEGDVIAVEDRSSETPDPDSPRPKEAGSLVLRQVESQGTGLVTRLLNLPRTFGTLAVLGGLWILFWALSVGAVLGYLVRRHLL